MAQRRYIGGFDIGGTKLTALVSDTNGNKRIVNSSLTTEEIDVKHGPEGIAKQMTRMLSRSLKKVNLSRARLAAIGIGSAGPLEGGAIKSSTNLPFDYIPLVEPMESEFNVPVGLKNDCNAGVLGEAYFGFGRGREDKTDLHIVYVTLSTGFGAGAYSGGHLIEGKDGNAAECGHFPAKEDGLKCGCKSYGCAESYGSGTGIKKNAAMQLINEDFESLIFDLALKKAAKESKSKKLSPWAALEYVDAEIVYKAARRNDKLAKRIIEEAGRYTGIAFASIANAYDPEVITIGGSVAVHNEDMVIPPIKEEMSKHLNVQSPDVIISPLKLQAVQYGALALAKMALDQEVDGAKEGPS